MGMCEWVRDVAKFVRYMNILVYFYLHNSKIAGRWMCACMDGKTKNVNVHSHITDVPRLNQQEIFLHMRYIENQFYLY